MDKIRTFIAIELNANVQNAISAILDDLRKTGADVKWVKPKDIHLTLKFLGDTPTDKIEPIEKILKECCRMRSPFALTLTHLGAFPSIESPKIIWLGAAAGKKEIKEFSLSIEEKLLELSFEKEKREFEPHLTLGRMRSMQNRFALVKAIKAHQLNPAISLEVDHIALIKSTLTPQGPIYETLKIFSLAKI